MEMWREYTVRNEVPKIISLSEKEIHKWKPFWNLSFLRFRVFFFSEASWLDFSQKIDLNSQHSSTCPLWDSHQRNFAVYLEEASGKKESERNQIS